MGSLPSFIFDKADKEDAVEPKFAAAAEADAPAAATAK